MKIALASIISTPLMIIAFQGCSSGNMAGVSNGASTATTGGGGGGGGGGGTTVQNTTPVAGRGATVTGTGALACPTAQAIVNSVQNVLGVSVTAGNTAAAYTQLASNLPATTDCTKASGFDNAQMFIYAACSDLANGTTAAARTKFATYGVTLNQSLASQKTALINAGMTMLNGYTGGVAGASNATAGITTALTNLVAPTAAGSTAPSTTTIGFMDVCIAANSAGALLLGN